LSRVERECIIEMFLYFEGTFKYETIEKRITSMVEYVTIVEIVVEK
jgi:hypothetical protein